MHEALFIELVYQRPRPPSFKNIIRVQKRKVYAMRSERQSHGLEGEAVPSRFATFTRVLSMSCEGDTKPLLTSRTP
jgi:hypothetical protein